LIEDPARLDPPLGDPIQAPVRAVGVDETAFLRATGAHPTLFATGIADLTPRPASTIARRGRGPLRHGPGRVAGRVRRAVESPSGDRVARPVPLGVRALSTQLPDTVRVLDPFHVVKLGLTAVDEVRRRVQHDTLGHRGRARDPLYDIRRLLRRRRDRLGPKARARLQAGLIAGDPTGEVTLAWTLAQDLMSLYQLTDPVQARRRTETLITDLRGCPIPELARLGRTLHAWRDELCAHFAHPAVSNGPTENLNLKIKNTKRIARGYRKFAHYRLRLLLNHGRIREDQSPTRIRTCRPRFAA
jgi:transposase